MAATKSSTEGRRRGSMSDRLQFSDIRLVLVGKTGVGKSSSGNTILGRDAFRAAVGHSSVTSECSKKKDEVLDRKVAVVDTPGLFDTSLSSETAEREISKCINMSAPGPHAILLVIKVGPFTAEERDAVKKVEEIFGEDVWRYTIILFTYGDRVQSDFEQMLKEATPELQEILKKAGHRYHVFNNVKANDRGQVLELFKKVDDMVSYNEGQFYSNPTYLEVVKMLDQREKELREFYQKKLEEEIKAVETKYEKKLTEAQQQTVKQQCECEVKELKRFYQRLQSRIRHDVEQMTKDCAVNKIAKKLSEKLMLN
ncbi:hypothetical protein Q5P01_019010 [Channa striata]|uniref:AIG1-type G domain-containing protein n=1 Tax=Channa striata TaxID=64152 RepID=A0AA88M091_CHASR|nr:hypothetical protein Q5P01_019010 [Channa striata]